MKKFLYEYYLYFTSAWFAYWLRRGINNDPAFCFFIGYGRSGHSLIGALLDAHPQIIISHEQNILEYLRRGYSRHQLFWLMIRNSRLFAKHGRKWNGYSYQVPGLWQGKYRNLLVIGDKKGGGTTHLFARDTKLLNEIHNVFVKSYAIHVIRNPFDIISTQAKRANPSNITEPGLEKQINHFFKMVDVIDKIKKTSRLNILDIYFEDFISEPDAELRKVLDFLNIEANDEYFESCTRIINKKIHKSRFEIHWTADLISKVELQINKFDFLKNYKYNC